MGAPLGPRLDIVVLDRAPLDLIERNLIRPSVVEFRRPRRLVVSAGSGSIGVLGLRRPPCCCAIRLGHQVTGRPAGRVGRGKRGEAGVGVV